MEDLLDASVTPATAAVYDNYVSKYLNFAHNLGASTNSYHPSTVERWLASLNKQHLAYGTIQSHLSALRHHVNRLGITVDLNTPRIRMLLQGIKKSTISYPIEKNVVTLSHLKRLCTTTKSLMLKSMFTLAFFGFLRPSEFCLTSSRHYLRRRYVKLKSGSISLTLNSFKHSQQPAKVKVRSFADKKICPWRTLRDYLSSTKLGPQAALFEMTADQFRNHLLEVSRLAGIKSKLSPHSFRHGGATWAASEHWSDARIRAHGRWRSNAYRKYVRAY